MFLRELANYHARVSVGTPGSTASMPAEYSLQTIPWLIHLDRAGNYLKAIRSSSGDNRRDLGKTFPVPFLRRSGTNIKPQLLADKAEIALGVPGDHPERAQSRHEVFRVLVEACAAVTHEATVEAVSRFLAGTRDEADIPDDLLASDFITFVVDGVRPVDRPSVQAFWATVAPNLAAKGLRTLTKEQIEGWTVSVTDEEPGQCIVCGEIRPVTRVHPLPIKVPRFIAAQPLLVVAADKEAFESYGLDQARVAPTCRSCAAAYANGLNSLLANEANHVFVGSVAFVFWTKENPGFAWATMLSDPNSGDVRKLIESAREGKRAAAEIDASPFFAAAFSGTGSRLVVRDWIDTTVGEAQRRLARYFALQELVEWDGTVGQPLPIWRLANATVRRGGHEQVPESVPSALLGLALGGVPLPLDLLFQAVRRNRAEQGVLRERAMLIKMVLGSHGGGDDAMVELDVTSQTPAYLCGRLLAVLEAVQRQALGRTNATIVDKFYGTASSAPASVFGTLLRDVRAHLAKLRKDPRTHAAYTALQQRLEEVMKPLKTFPATLTLQEQGMFALGYYHQRAADRRAARERHEAREAATTATEEAVLVPVDGDEDL